MALVDQYGSPYTYTAARGAVRNSGMRPWEPVQLKDIGKLVPAYDRMTLLSASRRLYLNEDILRGATEQKAMFSIGRAWRPKFKGQDAEWGEQARKWLEEEWFKICDVRGDGFDFKTKLFLWSVGIDRDGEAFELLTETSDGYPQLQSIPAHRVRNPMESGYGEESVIKAGKYRNAIVRDGIIYNRRGTPIAICYCDDSGNLIEQISLRDCFQICDRSWQEQGRGLPAFTPSLNALRDALQSHEWEQMAQLMMSSIGLIEKNERGGPDMNDPMNLLNEGANPSAGGPGVVVESYAAGQVRYFRSGSGSGLETIHNDRPGDAWESFHDRIIRKALVGIGWPYSLWKPSGQGTAERHEMEKAQAACEDRQDLMAPYALRVIGWAISKAVKIGILPPSPDWNSWELTYPRKLTIDKGRSEKGDIEMYRAGMHNQRDILGQYGRDWREHIRERAEEIAYRKLVAAEVGAAYGVEIEDREMMMLTPNDQASTDAEPTNQNEE